MLTRSDWLLRFIAGPPGTEGSVDRIRVMKGMFLFQHEHDAPPEVDYRFRPYDYGPFTSEVYHDLDLLKSRGLIAGIGDGRSGRERAYRVTTAGKDYLRSVVFDPVLAQELDGIRLELDQLSFRELLRRVYLAHPESAERSVARGILE